MIISALTFPGGPGKFMSADVNTHDQIHALFSNYTWAQVTRHNPLGNILWWKCTKVAFSI